MELTKIKIIVYLKLSKQPNQYFICIVNYNKHLIIIVYQNVKIVWPYGSLRKVKKIDREYVSYTSKQPKNKILEFSII